MKYVQTTTTMTTQQSEEEDKRNSIQIRREIDRYLSKDRSKEKAERRRYFVSLCTQKESFFFPKKINQSIQSILVFVLVIKTIGTKIVYDNEISHSITKNFEQSSHFFLSLSLCNTVDFSFE